MKDRVYKVYKIEKGVVIDHIPSGEALSVINVLRLADDLGKGIITIGMNLDSRKSGKKDIIKIENKMLTKDELNKIALIAPQASINRINNGSVEEKIKIEIPAEFKNLVLCPNPNCITRHEQIGSWFLTVSKNPITLKCHYCERVFNRDDVELS